MAASIKDVAKEAGVSIATVSRVLNEVDVVNDDTKKKVLDAIEKLDYSPNIVARSLKTQKTRTIGIVIPDVSSQFYAEIVRGCEDVANIYNYNVILCNTDQDKQKERDYIRILKEKMVDGIIYMSNYLETENLQYVTKNQLPVVLVENTNQDNEFPSIYIDNEKAAFDAVEYLIKKGNKKIVYIGVETNEKKASSLRYNGYCEALNAYNIDLDDKLIYFGDLITKSGYSGVIELIKRKVEFDAIFCCSDDIAIGAINALRDNNIRVPEDVDIVGFNNVNFASLFYPKITTIEMPMYDMGSIGTRILIKIINKRKIDKDHYLLEHKLIERDSCKK